MVNGSLIHDISVLHGMFGPPEAVLSTEIWREGSGLTTTLRYPNGIRAVLTWIDLPDLWAFEETFAVYARSERVIVVLPDRVQPRAADDGGRAGTGRRRRAVPSRTLLAREPVQARA